VDVRNDSCGRLQQDLCLADAKLNVQLGDSPLPKDKEFLDA
jgi:hypothetical protein